MAWLVEGRSVIEKYRLGLRLKRLPAFFACLLTSYKTCGLRRLHHPLPTLLGRPRQRTGGSGSRLGFGHRCQLSGSDSQGSAESRRKTREASGDRADKESSAQPASCPLHFLSGARSRTCMWPVCRLTNGLTRTPPLDCLFRSLRKIAMVSRSAPGPSAATHWMTAARNKLWEISRPLQNSAQ